MEVPVKTATVEQNQLINSYDARYITTIAESTFAINFVSDSWGAANTEHHFVKTIAEGRSISFTGGTTIHNSHCCCRSHSLSYFDNNHPTSIDVIRIDAPGRNHHSPSSDVHYPSYPNTYFPSEITDKAVLVSYFAPDLYNHHNYYRLLQTAG